MFDFLRNLGRSEEEEQQDTLSSYLDNELASADRDRFEQQLALNSDLRDELAEMQYWQLQMRNLPTRRILRNFTLDPALYGRRQQQPRAAYPMLRTATAMTALLFVIALSANFYLGGSSGNRAEQPAFLAMQEMATVADEAAPADGAAASIEMAAEESSGTFILEESIDKEAGEVPVEIRETEGEEVLAESVEEEVLSAEAQAVGGEEIAGKQPDLSPGLELDMIEGTASPSMARDSSAAAESAPAASPVEMQRAEEAPQPTGAPAQADAAAPPAAEYQSLDPPHVEDGADSVALLPVSNILGPVVIGLGLLLIFLIILTLLARGRR